MPVFNKMRDANSGGGGLFPVGGAPLSPCELKLLEESKITHDILLMLPTKGGINTSRWAAPEDRKAAVAKYEADKAAGKTNTKASLKKGLEGYKPEFLIRCDNDKSPHMDSVFTSAELTSASPAPPLNTRTTEFDMSDRVSKLIPLRNTPGQNITSDFYDSKIIRDSRCGSPIKCPTDRQSIWNQSSDILANQSEATRKQASTLTGKACPIIPIQAAKDSRTCHVLPHLQTRKDREHFRPTSQPIKPSLARPIQIENMQPPKPDQLPPHLRPPKTDKVPTLRTQKQFQSTTETVNIDSLPPHLRPPKAAKVCQKEVPQKQLQSTIPATKAGLPPHLRPPKSVEELAQHTFPNYVQGMISTKSLSRIPPHLRKPIGQAVSPSNFTDISLSPSNFPIEGICPSFGKTSSTAGLIEPTLSWASHIEPMGESVGVETGRKVEPNGHGYLSPHCRPNSSKISICGKKVAPVEQSKNGGNIATRTNEPNIEPVTAFKGRQYSIEEMLKIGSNPSLKKPHFTHSAMMYNICSFTKDNKTPNVVPLTRESLVSKTGAAPPRSIKSANTFERNISETSIQLQSTDDKSPHGKASPDCRNEIAHEDIGLRDWNGSWAPAPCSWENERNSFNNKFIPTYINIWNRGNGVFKSVDTTAERFLSGEGPVNTLHGTLMDTPQAPAAFPDTKNSTNVDKQRIQTSGTDCKMFIKKLVKDERRRARWRVSAQEQIDRVYEGPPSNPNTPLIPVYLRPARVKDIPGITALYNHYIQNSIITDDQEPVSEAQMLEFFKGLRKEFLPFIVAIKGEAPQKNQEVGNEFVVGYSCLIGNFGINTVATRGLRRFTSKINFFVDPNHLRKGIGRALLDRILSTSTSTHNGKEGYDWVVTEHESVQYNNIGYTGGGRRYHQLIIELPIEIKDDTFYPWFKEWLCRKFWFKQVALLDSVARTKAGRHDTRFLDIVIFQMEASIRECYAVDH